MFNPIIQWFYLPVTNFNSSEPFSGQIHCPNFLISLPFTENKSPPESEVIQTEENPEQQQDGEPENEPVEDSGSRDEKAQVQGKRQYRRRRTYLEKKFKCRFRLCSTRFSSAMALKNHLRNKHNVRKRYNHKKQK